MTDQEFNIVKTEYDSLKKEVLRLSVFPLILTLLTFLVPLNLVSRTARRMGESSTLYDVHGSGAVIFLVVIILVFYVVIFNITKIDRLAKDVKEKQTKVVKIKIVEIWEYPEKNRAAWKRLGENYTHEINYAKNNHRQIKTHFNEEEHPDYLNATELRIHLSKHAEILVKSEIV